MGVNEETERLLNEFLPQCFPLSETIWGLRSRLNHEQPLAEHIERLLESLGPAAESVAAFVKVHGLEANFLCSVFPSDLGGGYASGRVRLEPPLLQRIAAIGASLSVDVYPWEREDEGDKSED